MATHKLPGIFGPRKYSYEELAEATGHFSNEFSIGQGGFGQVFRGSLDGGIYAIKKLYDVKGFEDEIAVVSRVRHRNLVTMVGYCIEEANALIVLEYFPNKSLRFHLHENESLDWPKRMRIAIGSTKGLEYLHEHCKPKIIHQDIKPDNILLDDNFEPKVADFGLAWFFPDTISHLYKSIQGTIDFIDPERYERVSEEASDKSDVYSFGVVLLELITGRKLKYEDIQRAKARMMQALNGEYTNFVDFNLQNYNRREMKRMIFCAASCVYKPLNSRPTMKKIVRALEKDIPLKDIWDGNDCNFLKSITIIY
ncbi:proline-rich receptor-like protein kinase PERK15 [Hevea brasiliensis]|uniref:proline-rich receptor-like protein kinase PERK15 n=1 Tax=Hevea brasiliensis TaxID=3981 RepID=UPI0025E6FB08|nr:proline-rich receptor-like protein kinase PERK15 [Hevea brasiliensis]